MPKILEVSKTPAFLATLKGFVGFCGVQTYQVGDEMMVTHSRWESKVACEGGAAALGQVLKGHVADFIAGPPAPASVGPGVWAWTSSKSSGAKVAHRIIVLKLKSSEVMDQALALAKSKEADFDAIEGLVDITSFSTEANDALVVVAGYTTMAALEAATPKIGEILKEMGPLFGGPPEAMLGTTQFAYPEPLVSRPCIHIVWRVPSADEAEVDAYWKSHEEWMKGSHVMGLEGDDAVAPRLLEFYISKGEELNNPMDPASGKSGNLLYIMSETYAAAAGIGSHMEKGTKDWPGMAKLGEMGAKYNVFMEAGATSVFTCLSDVAVPMATAKGQPCIHIVWRVPTADEAEVDAYWKSHQNCELVVIEYRGSSIPLSRPHAHPSTAPHDRGSCSHCVAGMRSSHVMGLEGDDAVAPRLTSFYISKGEELNNPMDPASGKSGNLLYIMSETYAAAAGIGSHMEKGTKDWPGMAKLGEMGAKYNVFMEAGTTSVFTNLDGGVLKPAPAAAAVDASTPTPGSAPTVEQLTGLGLPQAQAEASLKVIAEKPPVTGIPTHVYGMMKVKEGADIEAMTAGLEAYGAASKACPGKVSASYTISDGEIQFIEIYDSPAAMDIHIGFCL